MGKVYCIKAYEVPEAQRQAKGRAIINLLQLSDGEKVNAIIQRRKEDKGFLIMATKNGLIKKTDLSEFESIRKVGKIAIKLVENDELIGVSLIDDNIDVLMASSKGKCIRFNHGDVRPMGRDTQGVRSMKLDKGDFIVDMAIVKSGDQIITVSENGFGKRSLEDDYRTQIRGGKGVKAGNFNAKTGKLVNLKRVSEDQDVMLIADSGVIIRIPLLEISIFGRDTQGVRIMRLKDEAKIVCVATAEKDEDEVADANTDGQDLTQTINEANETEI
jgi:DNA gyrase subunit A